MIGNKNKSAMMSKFNWNSGNVIIPIMNAMVIFINGKSFKCKILKLMV